MYMEKKKERRNNNKKGEKEKGQKKKGGGKGQVQVRWKTLVAMDRWVTVQEKEIKATNKRKIFGFPEFKHIVIPSSYKKLSM